MGILRRVFGGAEVHLSAEHVVGRLPSCRLSLTQSFVSLAHALLRHNGEFWELRDLGSTNGTFLNDVRLQQGESVRVRRGARLAFGDRGELWELVDDREPVPAAVPLDGGEARFLEAGAIVIPSPTNPLATIFVEGDSWVMELDETRQAIAPDEHFTVMGRKWRFECPGAASSTFARPELLSLSDIKLVFSASRDEEHVKLSVQSSNGSKLLKEKQCFYLAYVLARRRQEDEATAVAEPGWLDTDQVLRMIPEFNEERFNVEIHRLRRALAEAGVSDAMQVVERRRGQVRFGTDRFDFERQGEPQARVAER